MAVLLCSCCINCCGCVFAVVAVFVFVVLVCVDASIGDNEMLR